MALTQESPNRPGWYWAKTEGADEAVVVEVMWLGETLYCVDEKRPVDDMEGWWWDGPIQRPGDEPKEKEPLFQDRTPEAAARQLATVLACLMEAELATLERLDRLSSSSKRETERHRDIARKGVHHCQKLGVEPRGLNGKTCTRLARRLEKH
jgi:hypothetical protein